ncbi:MAG: hypothetical protein IT462_09400 [Planctomycetes bacterium]|nr:hypothetical protein [Planctomycetota bacterium]
MESGARWIGPFVFAFLGCGALALAALMQPPRVTHEPSPTAKPAIAEPKAPPQDWLDHSPLHFVMRAMWADCGMVLLHARDTETGNLESIECSAEDIARKAGRFAQLYAAVAKPANDLGRAAKDGQWDAAATAYERLNKACCDCHVEYWPPKLRGFNADVVKLWREKGSPVDETPWSYDYAERLEHPPTTPYRSLMRCWNDGTGDIASALEKRDAAGTQESAGDLFKSVDNQAQAWTRLNERARSMQQFAMRGNFAPMKGTYERMIAECNSCHAALVDKPPEMLTPLPWR